MNKVIPAKDMKDNDLIGAFGDLMMDVGKLESILGASQDQRGGIDTIGVLVAARLAEFGEELDRRFPNKETTQ